MDDREYEWNIDLRPYGDDVNAGVVRVDTRSRYGYWERHDGAEGGGLWFDQMDSSIEPVGEFWPPERLELIDYDGTSDYLPGIVTRALRGAGFVVHADINPEA